MYVNWQGQAVLEAEDGLTNTQMRTSPILWIVCRAFGETPYFVCYTSNVHN